METKDIALMRSIAASAASESGGNTAVFDLSDYGLEMTNGSTCEDTTLLTDISAAYKAGNDVYVQADYYGVRKMICRVTGYIYLNDGSIGGVCFNGADTVGGKLLALTGCIANTSTGLLVMCGYTQVGT